MTLSQKYPCPLIWLIHLLGDVHQPLHVGYGRDYGGNEVKVTLFGQDTELHAVWDSGMVYHYLDPSNGDWFTLYQALAADLQANPTLVTQFAAVTDPVAWANESIAYVISNCYDWPATSGTPALGDE